MDHAKRWYPLIIGLIVVLAAVLRLWRLPATLQFLGDQGRDALIVADIFREGDLVFIGPVTSVGNMYLGPLYYYFMVPFLWLSYPSPLGPAYAVAILGIAAVYLTYRLGKELVGDRAAMIGAFFLTFSWMAVTYSRFSWNPNPAPFVSIIMVWATYRAWRKSAWYWVLVSACFSVLIQLHYLTLLSAAGAGLIWLLHLAESFMASPKDRLKRMKNLGLATAVAAVVFALSLTPLMLFDYKHDWLNARAFSELFTQEQAFTTTGAESQLDKTWKTVQETHGRSLHILAEHALGEDRLLNTIVVLAILGTLGIVLYRNRRDYSEVAGELVIAAYLLMGIIGTAFYKHSLFVHYFAYLYPTIFLTYGIVFSTWIKWHRWVGSLALVVFAAAFIWFNTQLYPLKPIAMNTRDFAAVAQTIEDRVEPGEKYNIILLSETKDIDGQSYRYFLHTTDTPPVETEKRGEISKLFIIDEEKKLDDVTASPIYEIVVFPNKEPIEVYSVPEGPTITVLETAQ